MFLTRIEDFPDIELNFSLILQEFQEELMLSLYAHGAWEEFMRLIEEVETLRKPSKLFIFLMTSHILNPKLEQTSAFIEMAAL